MSTSNSPIGWSLDTATSFCSRRQLPCAGYDKAERRVELTATVSEAVADAFENAKALRAEGFSVVVQT